MDVSHRPSARGGINPDLEEHLQPAPSARLSVGDLTLGEGKEEQRELRYQERMKERKVG